MFTHDPIVCGDSLTIMRQLPGGSYDAIITDHGVELSPEYARIARDRLASLAD